MSELTPTISDYIAWLHPDGGLLNLSLTYPTPVSIRSQLRDWHTWVIPHSDLIPFAKAATKEGGKPAAVYVGLHKLKANTQAPNGWPNSADVEAFQFVYIDVDVKTDPGHLCASDAERRKAHTLTEKIAADLAGFARSEGLTLNDPAKLDTGNGGSLLYPFDLPNTEANVGLLRSFIRAIAKRYNGDGLDIDVKVTADLARVSGVVGTVNATPRKKAVEADGRVPRARRLLAPLPSREPLAEDDAVAFLTAYVNAAGATELSLSVPSSTTVGSTSKTGEALKVAPDDPVAEVDSAAFHSLSSWTTNYLNKCAIRGDVNGHERAFQLAGQLFARRHETIDGPRLGPDDVLRLMLDSTWNKACTPHWTADDVTAGGKTEKGLRGPVWSAWNGNGTPPAVQVITSACSSVVDQDDATEAVVETVPPLSIDLKNFPQRVGELVAGLCNDNRQLPPICNLLPALATVGAIIGKRLLAVNGSQTYYPNLWVVSLAPTGANKSGTQATISRLLDQGGLLLPTNGTIDGLYLHLGTTIPAKDWQGLDRGARHQKKQELQSVAQADPNGWAFAPDECTDGLKDLMGGWDSKNPGRHLGRVLQLANSGNALDKSTKTGGVEMMFDLCLSFIGVTQPATWNRDIGGAVNKDVGLFGRFIPATEAVKLLNVPVERRSFTEVLDQGVKPLTERLGDSRVNCSFGVTLDADPIADAMKALEAGAVCQYLKRVFPLDWTRLRNKIIVHALRLSLVMAFLDHAFELGDSRSAEAAFSTVEKNVNVLRYFGPCAELVACCYTGYLTGTDGGESEAEARVVSVLKRGGYVVQRNLQNATKLFGPTFTAVVSGLVGSGRVAVVEPKAKQAYREALRKAGEGDCRRCTSPVFFIPLN